MPIAKIITTMLIATLADATLIIRRVMLLLPFELSFRAIKIPKFKIFYKKLHATIKLIEQSFNVKLSIVIYIT